MTDLSGIKAALFDLDGTLLDSNDVWKTVDRLFFTRRGMVMPEDYPRSIAGMSYMTTAVYTKERFELPESPEAIADEWTRDAIHEYAENVPLKSGAKELLEFLRDRGVRLCVVTTNREEIFVPCLKRCGILNLFEFCMTTDQAGGGSKKDGRLYRAAADRLEADYADCAVFEDVWEGIAGAKSAGMRAYCVVDPFYTHNRDKIMETADGTADSPGGFIK